MASSTSSSAAAPASNTDDLTSEQALSLADSLFVDESFDEAVDAYTAAEAVLPENENDTTSVLRFRIVSHRAQALLELQKRDTDALQDATRATSTLLPALTTSQTALLRVGETELAWQRRGMAALRLQRYPDALSSLEQAQQLAILNQRPTQHKYPAWIAECHAKMVKETKAADTATETTTTTAPSAASAAKTTTATAAARPPPTNTITNPTSTGMPKYQYYQTDSIMTISILEPNVAIENLHVDFQSNYLTVIVTKPNDHNKSYTVIAGNLYAEVDPEQCKIKLKPEKVLLKLKKVDKYEWSNLLGKTVVETKGKAKNSKPSKSSNNNNKTYTETTMEEAGADFLGSTTTTTTTTTKENDAPTAAAASKPAAATTAAPKVPRPYASHKDWDSIERELQQEEANETPQGDEAMNKLFQQIYKNADEDTRRAMVKSYQTSGGTCLSTNWGEVASKDYEKERTAPKGMEWKNWEGDKLPQEKNDD